MRIEEQLINRAMGLLGEVCEEAIVVCRTADGRVHVRSVGDDKLVQMGLLTVGNDVLLGEAESSHGVLLEGDDDAMLPLE